MGERELRICEQASHISNVMEQLEEARHMVRESEKEVATLKNKLESQQLQLGIFVAEIEDKTNKVEEMKETNEQQSIELEKANALLVEAQQGAAQQDEQLKETVAKVEELTEAH